MYRLFFILSVFILFTCTQKRQESYTISDLYEKIKQRKKWPRFKNVKLLFGDTLNELELRSLGLNKDLNNTKIYSSFLFERGECIYFLYGVSHEDSLVSKMQLRSFCNEIFISDTLLIDFMKYGNTDFDYWIGEEIITVQSLKSDRASHYSTYEMAQGFLNNITIVPDSIFVIKPLDLEGVGTKVHIYNDYDSKELILPSGAAFKLEGRLYKLHSIPIHWLIQLDKNEHIKTDFVSIRAIRNTATSLFLVSSDSMIIKQDGKYYEVPSLYEEPNLFLDRVYVDYKY